MMARPTTLIAALVVALVAAAPARADAVADLERWQQNLFERVAPSVVFIQRGKAFGSGFFVGTRRILTNAHVVGSDDHVTVTLRDGQKLRGRVTARGADGYDAAIVTLPRGVGKALEIGGVNELRIGSVLASVGHGRGGIWSLNTGLASNIYRLASGQSVIQTQIPLNPGSSGGPILDRHGRVVGMVVSGITRANGINFALRVDDIVAALPALDDVCRCLVVTAPSGVPVFIDKRMAGKGPRLVAFPSPGPRQVFAVIEGQMRRRRVVVQQGKSSYVRLTRP